MYIRTAKRRELQDVDIFSVKLYKPRQKMRNHKLMYTLTCGFSFFHKSNFSCNLTEEEEEVEIISENMYKPRRQSY